jgi:hypothetical protein
VPSAGAASGDSTCSSPPALASPCWSSRGGKSGSVASASGAGSAGVDSPEADGSGAGVARAGSVGVDSLGADGSGAGVVVAGFDLGGAALADLTKPIQLYHHTSRTKQNVHYATRCKLTASTSS